MQSIAIVPYLTVQCVYMRPICLCYAVHNMLLVVVLADDMQVFVYIPSCCFIV